MRLFLLFAITLSATEPDAATRNWWRHIEALANDGMKGRDTGSPEHRTAAEYVARQFQQAGAKAVLQPVPLRRDKLSATFELVDASGAVTSLRFLEQITSTVRAGTFSAPLAMPGDTDIAGKIVVQKGRFGMPAANYPGALGTLTIDTAEGPEPPRWPVPYAVSVRLRDTPAPELKQYAFRLNPADAALLHPGQTLRGTLKLTSEDIVSDNVLATLPGDTSPDEYVALTAHLDGYGTGTPRNGDAIYNGAFDDAAYVATLLEFAQSRPKLKRSLLFAVFTGEEKGLLGSKYYVQHPELPNEKVIADINLDQLRPIFPLRLLTTLALNDSTLGDTVKQVAATMNIEIQPDPEPQRNLLRRSDHINFMNIGIPAVGFIFGYRPRSPEEAVYRTWYRDRYHSPADDLQQPWDPKAAADFNTFFAKVATAVANAPERPHWKPGSAFGKSK